MTLQDLIRKYNATEVMGNLLVRIDGHNVHMAKFDADGYTLNEIGQKLEAGQLRAEGQIDGEPPKAAKRKKAAVADDLSAGVDE